MVNRFTKLASLLVITLLMGCSKDDDGPQQVSGVIEFSTVGPQNLIINANNVTATITVIGAGGGGAGGVGYTSGTNSTGGGGGGGAGEIMTYAGVPLMGNATYTVTVGQGGTRGNVGNGGIDGQDSTIDFGGVPYFMANGGMGGDSRSNNNIQGGLGGDGFPDGGNGGNGTSAGAVSGNANEGFGGQAGNNSTAYGRGGAGGKGTGLVSFSPIPANLGADGGNGYVRVEWVGTSN